LCFTNLAHLTKRCSQPLTRWKITNVKIDSGKGMRKFALASGG